MGSRIEITLAFLLARRRSRWSAEQLRAYQRKLVRIDGCEIETSIQFEELFTERNVLGMSVDEARAAAERELAGHASAFPGFSWGLSTGTMGRAGVFLTSERERNQWIGTVLGKFLSLRMLAGSDVALVLKRNNRLYTDVRKARGLRLHYFDAAAPVEEWAGKLCSLAPRVLIGPPSVLERIAWSAAFTRRPFRPQLLLAGAEPLFPQDKALLEQAYGVAPRVIYQAKEGFLAAGCRNGGIHLNQDLIYFEALPLDRARFVPVITDFTRTSQTYRRFRLDDVLIAGSGACSCGQGFTNLSAVEGRAHDVLLFEKKCIFPLEINQLLLRHVSGADRPRDYCVCQVAADRITVAVEGGTPSELARALAVLVGPAEVSVAQYQAPNPGEKRRRVRRLFDSHNDWLNRLTVSRNVLSGV